MSDQFNPNEYNADDLLLSGGAPFFAFDKPGDSVTGYVLEKVVAAQHEFGPDGKPTPELRRYKSGAIAKEIQITLQTELRDPERQGDDGRRRVKVKEFGQPKDALSKAIHDSGEPGLTLGGRLTMTRVADGVPANKALNAPRQYMFRFSGPADAALGSSPDVPVQDSTPAEPPYSERLARKTTAEILQENGLSPDLAPLLGDNPTPELIEALKNQ